MKQILFVFIAVLFCMNVNAQAKVEKLGKKEAKEILEKLTPEEKTKLLNQLLVNDEKLVNKTLKKALKSANKEHIDVFMQRKDLVYTPMQPTQKNSREIVAQERAEKLREAQMPTKEEIEAGQRKAIEERARLEQIGHEGHNHAAEEKGKVDSPVSYVMVDKDAGPTTTIQFEEESFDFGTLKDGESVTHTYKFTNTGSEPYIISKAKGSCGCTVPVWSKEPIAPGQTSEIVVTFNSKNKGSVGGQNQIKRVTITGNTAPADTYLIIKGTVTKDQ